MLQGIGRDFRLAARRLLATPLFSIFAVLSVAVGVGVTTVAHSIVDALFFSGVQIADAERTLFLIGPDNGRARFQSIVSRPDFDDLRATAKSFDGLAASRTIGAAVAGPTTTEMMAVEAVTGDYFSVVGVPAVLGRMLQPSDDNPPAAVAVLGEDLWRRRFGADPAVIGRVLRLSGEPFEIVGVAPRSFVGVANSFAPIGTRVWIPLDTAARLAPTFHPMFQPQPVGPSAAVPPTPERERRQLLVLGRLKAGVEVASASAELSSIGTSLDSTYPNTVPQAGSRQIPQRSWRARTVADSHAQGSGDTLRFGTIIAAMVWLVLVVACTNLSNLVLARGAIRRQEFAIRRALGAARWRLIREQAAESLVIASVGGLAAYAVMRLLVSSLSLDVPLSRAFVLSLQPALDPGTLTIAAVALVLSLLVFGLEPAIQLTRANDVRDQLARGAGGLGGASPRRQRTLLRWQVAISTGFFILASLSVKFVFVEMGHDSGIEIDRFVVATMNFQQQGWDEARTRRVLARIVVEAQQEPNLAGAAVSSGLPMLHVTQTVHLSTPDRPLVQDATSVRSQVIPTTPGIFETTGITILRGRNFDDRDRLGSAPVVVLSETGALKTFGTIDAVDRQIRMQWVTQASAQTATVIGIASDTDTTYLGDRREPVAYVPFEQHFSPVITVTARGSRSTAAAIGALQAALRRADPDAATDSIATGRAMLTGPYSFLRFFGLASVSLGLLTLVLSMVGLYGVQSHGVSARTREIGVRMSFGATAGQIRRMVLKDGYRPVFEGMGIGLFIGIAGRAIIRAYLDVRMDVVDPWMMLTVPVPLLLAAFCACYLPARSASNVEPNVALRQL